MNFSFNFERSLKNQFKVHHDFSPLHFFLYWMIYLNVEYMDSSVLDSKGTADKGVAHRNINNKRNQWDPELKDTHLLFPGGSVVKNAPVNEGQAGSIPGLGWAPGVGNSTPLQCSCLGNPMDRGVWQATVHVVAKNQTWWATKHIFIYLKYPTHEWAHTQTHKQGSAIPHFSMAGIVVRFLKVKA